MERLQNLSPPTESGSSLRARLTSRAACVGSVHAHRATSAPRYQTSLPYQKLVGGCLYRARVPTSSIEALLRRQRDRATLCGRVTKAIITLRLNCPRGDFAPCAS